MVEATLMSPAPAAAMVKQVRLSRGTLLEVGETGETKLSWNGTTAGAGRVSDWMLALLRQMAEGPVAADDLQARALASGGPAGLFRWVENLRRLDSTGMLEHSVSLGPELICAVRPVGTGPSERQPAFDPSARQRLSRFTVIRVVDGALVAAHPDSHLATELGPGAAALLAHLADWTNWEDISAAVPGLPGPAIRAVLDHLARSGAIDQAPAGAGPAGETSPAAQWNPFDWWLHARSRNPRVVSGWGGTYPGRGTLRSNSTRSPSPYPGRTLALPVPDLSQVAADGSTLVDVMERRRSLRVHDDENPVTLAQLGEFLYRAVRTRTLVHPADGSDTLLDRPYPGGGALHELETYVAARRCDGLQAGLWHYQGMDHRLTRVADGDGPVTDLLTAAQTAAQMTAAPQVVLILAARFGRVMYKYDAIAYALTLKHVGVVLNNFYLVATDMGLAPTAVGSGDAHTFAAATGRDPMAEGSVGEFVLGSLPAGHRPRYLTQWGA